ncbi:helix-turn-helix transcriptional regulator [Streptomyces sp. WAC 01529]|uniref:helix-turn-helix domain-containing protein n=1 Tax=Streptomyces sp. WAC 01529 TaxID=2203205 RepID=UPI0013DFD15F|nr:helix-turn-helix transcriptional regulator [Streptomyces sp. WAC 01529]
MAAQDPSPTDDQRTQFRDLIRELRQQSGLSLVRFAERAVDPLTKTTVKPGWIHRLESGEPVTPPQLPELRALAEAGGCDLEILQDAASAQFHGVDPVYSASGEARAFVRKTERLTPKQRAQLQAFLDTIVPAEGE